MTLNSTKGLLLIHPAITTTPELLESKKLELSNENVEVSNQFLINKINDSTVVLSANEYDLIYYLTPEKPDQIKFPKKLIPILSESLRVNGKLYGLSDVLKVDALINGFEIVNSGEYYWKKKSHDESIQSVSLLTKKSAKTSDSSALPKFKKINDGDKPLPVFNKIKNQSVSITNEEDQVDKDEKKNQIAIDPSKAKFFDNSLDDEIIDEDELLDNSANDLDNGSITMITCGKTKTRRRKACKDCTCGLKEEEETEIEQIRNMQEKAIKFTSEELTEIDFTIENVKVGGCGSCALGDAFRCSGCPYLGLPAFKPGQAINLSSIADDL